MDDKVLVLEMISYIEQHLRETGSRDLVTYSGYSLNRLRQKFFAITGDTPSGYLRKRRLTEAAKEILSGEPIIETCLKYGYSSQDNFTTAFRSYFGVTPKEIYTMDRKYKRFIAQLREVFNIMELSNLKQPPFCSTLMGAIKGAADYFDLDFTPPMLYGLSGHVFLINIHNELCPSGPYAWDKKGFFRCLSNMGIDFVKESWFERGASERALKEMEGEIKEGLNNGRLCILEFLEYQLVSGYDEESFHLTLPWGGTAHSECESLSMSSWKECLEKEGFAGIKIIERGKLQSDFTAMLKDALTFGLEIYRNPEQHEFEGYGIGFRAYKNWIEAVKAGHGSEHGNWWNGMVWAENRKIGSEFFAEVREFMKNETAVQQCSILQQLYADISSRLDRIKEKDLAGDEKLRMLNECLEKEHTAEAAIHTILGVLE